MHIAYEETRPTNRLRDVAIEVETGDRSGQTPTDSERPAEGARSHGRLEEVRPTVGGEMLAQPVQEAVEIGLVQPRQRTYGRKPAPAKPTTSAAEPAFTENAAL